MINELYLGYDNPIRARQIWQSYLKDVHRFVCLDKARGIRMSCTRAEVLDIRLDKLISHLEMSNRAVSNNFIPSDPDANGGWANIVRAIEGA